jgi:hypothetical protein
MVQQRGDLLNLQLVQTPNDKVRRRQLLHRMCRRDGHHLHARGVRSFDADVRVFKDNAAFRADSDPLRCCCKNFRVRFPMLHIFGRDNFAERALQSDSIEHAVDI